MLELGSGWVVDLPGFRQHGFTWQPSTWIHLLAVSMDSPGSSVNFRPATPTLDFENSCFYILFCQFDVSTLPMSHLPLPKLAL